MKTFAVALGMLCSGAQGAGYTLTIATEVFPPFCLEANGKAVGPLPEIVQATCLRMQANCIIRVLPWRRALQMIDLGNLDGAFPLARLPQREQQYYLTGPTVDTGYAVYSMLGSTYRYSQPKDFTGRTIAAYGPSGTSMTLEALSAGLPRVHLVHETDNQTVLTKLGAGRYGIRGLAFVNRDVAQYLLDQGSVDNVQWAGDVKQIQYYIGLSRKTVPAEQAEAFERAFDELLKSGRVRAILDKYKLPLGGPLAHAGRRGSETQRS